MVSYKKLSFSMDVPRAAWSWMMINSVVYIFFLVMFYLAILALSQTVLFTTLDLLPAFLTIGSWIA